MFYKLTIISLERSVCVPKSLIDPGFGRLTQELLGLDELMCRFKNAVSVALIELTDCARFVDSKSVV